MRDLAVGLLASLLVISFLGSVVAEARGVRVEDVYRWLDAWQERREERRLRRILDSL